LVSADSFVGDRTVLKVGLACSFDILEYKVGVERKRKAINIKPAPPEVTPATDGIHNVLAVENPNAKPCGPPRSPDISTLASDESRKDHCFNWSF
jgi:hypothetical protein